MRSGAQPPIGSTWQLGSVSEPRPPVGCSPRVRPFPPRPPPEVAFLCSVASSVLRPHPTSHPRTCSACGYCLPEPARTSPGAGETSQVPHKELLHVHKVSDCARFFPCKPIRHGRCCLLFSFPPGFARPAAHETLLVCGRVVGTEVGISLVQLSPFFSWTRGSWSTSDCRHGPSLAPEHA